MVLVCPVQASLMTDFLTIFFGTYLNVRQYAICRDVPKNNGDHINGAQNKTLKISVLDRAFYLACLACTKTRSTHI